ncbi:MAG: hypothetical protein V2I39_04550, partial [Erythrobacter sp.]|nr:hypothetical protein [Erythrobacter sp.]
AQPGDDEVIALWRRVQSQLVTSLPSVKADMIEGNEDYRQVNRALKFTRQQVSELAEALAQADRDEAAARKMARDRFGGSA